MAPKEEASEGGKKNIISKIIPMGTVYDSVWNWISDRFAKRGVIFPWRTIPGQEPTTKKRLDPLMRKNNHMIIFLQQIESEWPRVKSELGDFEGNPDKKEPINMADGTVTMMYKDIGPYTDIFNAAYEISLFRDGAHAERKEITDERGPLFNTSIKYPKLDVKGAKVINPDGTRETLLPLGFILLGNITKEFEQQKNLFTGSLVRDACLGSSVQGKINDVIRQRNDLLVKLKEYEKRHHDFLAETVVPAVSKLPAKKKIIFDNRPKKVRFLHPYKIIRRFILVQEEKKKYVPILEKLQMKGEVKPAILIEELKRIENIITINFEESFKHPEFKHPNWKDGGPYWKDNKFVWEVAPGLDSRGYPLEVDEDGTVLLDKWWYETYKNEWQRELVEIKCGAKEHKDSKFHSLRRTIRLKQTIPGNWKDINTNAGEVYAMLHYFDNKEKIRKVNSAFVDDLDLIEAGSHIDNEYDAYRDDIRDARTHWWSKTVYDYTLAMFKWDRNKVLHNPIYRGMIPDKKIDVHFDCEKDTGEYGYIEAYPDKFEKNIPKDEQKVTSTYDYFDTYDVKTGAFKADPSLKPKKGEEPYRIPTHINPAFDRRAIGSNWIHWGRMYYYDPVEHQCRYSENPYPTITTRGIGKFIIYSILKREKKFTDQRASVAKCEKGYDYGIRAFGLKQFPRDVLSPGTILQYGKYPHQ